ncbi:hypothetical protein F4781DRAFT_403867 [Annulohypoxylon bovei var. microspora]|nr:hypothetical protein F4781DRAFT_403867 [Annulohypoxylon bovei var. microspora]
MAFVWEKRYEHRGVLIPHELSVNAHDQEIEGGDINMARDGILLVQIIKDNIYIVQSISNRRLYVVKYFEKADPALGHHQFRHDHPPEYRVSTIPGAIARLPNQPQFPRLEFFQRYWDEGFKWELYFEYFNGGTLENLRQRYYEEHIRIPEEFIWHVTAELCKALRFLYYGLREGQPTPAVPLPWNRIYHRDIDLNNILIHYERRGRGRPPPSGNPRNAFPRIVLVDFGESAVDGDDPNDLRPGQFEEEDQPNEWEDIYQVGYVLRSLCMTHVLLPEDEPLLADRVAIPGQFKDEGQGWYDRPDSRLLADVNAHPVGAAYSVQLMDLLGQFEWGDQEDASIWDPGYRDVVQPTMEWICTTLLDAARTHVDGYLARQKPARYYDDIDVSWTKPLMPMPHIVNPDDNVGAARQLISGQIKRDNFVFCSMAYPAARSTIPFPQPPR